MAASSTPQGYQCEFVDSVPEDYYCKKCCLVAKKITITNCCGENYCHVCIHSTQQDNKPCPGCGEQTFNIFPVVKSQKKILSLQVYCSAKERGCGWSGPLEHLDAHLDPDTGDCQYTDIQCPLKCDKKINRKILDHHLAKECVKRDYICPYCSFKALYEIVTNIHLPECTYYSLACPNRCGVTCERPTMEDHLKICPLQEVECEFQHAGCAEKFSREEEEEHMREKAQTHLNMMARASAKMSQEFQTKLQEQEKRFEEKLFTQEKIFKEQLQVQEVKIQKLQKEFQKISEENKAKLEKHSFEPQTFMMKSFSQERDLKNDWKSPAMYTHPNGYKFCIGVDANGHGPILPGLVGTARSNAAVYLDLWLMKGEYDDTLPWPVKGTITIELINHFESGENKAVTQTFTWKKPGEQRTLIKGSQDRWFLIRHSELPHLPDKQIHFLESDALHFKVTGVITLRRQLHGNVLLL